MKSRDKKILPLNSDAGQLRGALAILMPYAVEIRYPDDWYMPSAEDVKEVRSTASKILSWFEKALPEIFQDSQND